MFAIGFLLVVLTSFLFWLDDKHDVSVPMWAVAGAAILWLSGMAMMLIGLVMFLWVYMP